MSQGQTVEKIKQGGAEGGKGETNGKSGGLVGVDPPDSTIPQKDKKVETENQKGDG